MVTDTLSEKERTLIDRAGLHALKPETAPLHLLFRNDVTDLDAARLLHRIERGAVIVPMQSRHAWHENGGPRFPRFSIIVEECLRLGLVRRDSVVTGRYRRRIQLAAAMVHLRGPDAAWRTMCPASMLAPDLRYRVTDEAALVDCLTCLGIHR